MAKTLDKPRTRRPGGGNDDNVVHTLRFGVPIEPGVKALCGTRIKGIAVSRYSGKPLCTMCEALRKDGGLV